MRNPFRCYQVKVSRTNYPIKDAHCDNGCKRPERVPKNEEGVIKDASVKPYVKHIPRQVVTEHDSLSRTPRSIDLEPPQYTNTNDIFVEKVQDPRGECEAMTKDEFVDGARTCCHSEHRTSDRAQRAAVSRSETKKWH